MVVFIRSAEIYNDSRATKEINALLESGYKVFAIGWDKTGDALERCNTVFKNKNIHFSFYEKSIVGGIGFKGLGKLMGFMHFVKKQLKMVKSDTKVIHACDLDSGWPAYQFAKRHKIKFFYDIYDYYVDTHYIPFPLRSIVERMEIKTINYADVTIICTEERFEQISRSKPKKVIVMHNSPDINEGPSFDNALYDYSYCGTLSEMRLLNEILAEYRNNDDIRICFAGSGRLASFVEDVQKQNSNFTFLGAVSYSEVIDIERQSLVISAIYEPTIRNHRLCAPNKFYEALALGKPVIVCKGTGIDKIVEQNNVGISIDYDAKLFFKAVRYLISNPQLMKEMGMRGRELYQKKYKWEIMKTRLLEEYSKVPQLKYI